MNEKLKQFPGKIKELVGKTSKKVRILILTTLAVIALAVAALCVFNATRPYTVLFTGLNGDDMQKILEYLETNNYHSYRVEEEDTILVPESQEPVLKGKIISAGAYPTSGYGYRTYLDNNNGLLPDSAQQQLIQYDLQDRLSAVIRNMNGVKDAVVTLTPGENGRYILNQENVVEATGNVVVTMQDGMEMTGELADGIRSLLATSLQGLKIDNVAILDQAGNLYSGGESASASDASDLKMTLEARVNATVQAKVLQALTPFFGADNVKVSVYSTVDVSRTYEEFIQYFYPEETNWDSLGGHGLIGRYIWNNNIVRGDDTAAGGVPGPTTNSDLNEYITQGEGITGNEQQLGTSGTIEHDNDQKTTQKDNAGGVITDVQVSVSINSRTAGEVNPANFVSHVARAAGIDSQVQAEKISILAMPFYQESALPTPIPTPGGMQGWMLYALIAGVALFLVLLILILVLRSRAKKKKAAKLRAEEEEAARRAAEEAAAALAGATPKKGADIMDLNSERSMELRQDVRKFAEENPEIAAQMVKAWLKGGDEHG